jgi:lipoic acid synthetase
MPAVPTEAILPSRKIYAADYLGLVPYELALKWQEALVPARAEGVIPDCLLLLQHPPVLTVGRFRGDEDIMVPPEVLAERGVTIFHTNRGGGTTYHGPGQLVGYPIMNLIENNFGVREYLRKLEEVILKLLLVFGLRGHRVTRYPGVWIGDHKICSIGIHVSRHITMHGFALNVNNDLQPFDDINPCGLKGKVMTSASELLGYRVEIEDVIASLLDCFLAVFGGLLLPQTLDGGHHPSPRRQRVPFLNQ